MVTVEKLQVARFFLWWDGVMCSGNFVVSMPQRERKRIRNQQPKSSRWFPG